MICSESIQKMKATAARSNPKLHARLHKIQVGLTIMLVSLVLFCFIKQEYAIYTMRRKAADLRSQLEVLKVQNDLLRAKTRALNDDRVIEQIARDSLGLVKAGEIQYLLKERQVQ